VDVAEVLEKAHVQSGLPMRGMESFRPALDILIEDMNRSKTFTPAGRAGAEAYVVDTLIARFKIEDWVVRNPAVTTSSVERPLFIMGMPRAGTTLLLNLLRLDPQRRVYWHWEGNREVPPAETAHLHDDPRIAQRVAEVNAGIASGAFQAHHHLEMGDEPTECLWTLGQDFKAYPWLVQTQVPNYFEWLMDKADMLSAYRHHKHALQVMQSRAPGRWTLKFPSHALFLDSLLRVYPDARVLFTHRDPVKPVGSTCSVCEHILSLSNSSVDRHVLGYQTAKLISQSALRMTAVRDAHPEVPFLDLHYRTFVKDPIGEIARLYKFEEMPFPDAVAKRMEAAFAASRQERDARGEHRYRLEDYGLSNAALATMFKGYTERYGIALEN